MPPTSLPTPRSSLARSTLIKMGVRIAVVIALTTFVSYLHLFYSMRTQTLARLEQHVSERGQREQAIFVLAEDYHALLAKPLEERLRVWSQEDPSARFSSLFAHLPDGTIRNQPQGFDGTRMPGVFVARGVTDDIDFRRRLLAVYDVVAQYGPAFHARFTDTYIILPEGATVVYWPENPTWCQDAASDYQFVTSELFTNTLPQKNPRRETVWTGIFEDEPSRKWMVSVTTPLDVDGRHVATVGHDVLLDELMERTINDRLPGAYNMLIRDDGQLIAHPELKVKSGAGVYNVLSVGQPGDAPMWPGGTKQQAHLRGIFERVRSRQPGQTVLELPEYGDYVAVARLKGPGWNFVTVLPERVVSSAAFHTARFVLAFGVAALLLELIIMYWVLREQITRPLLAFTQATAQVAAGDFKVSLESSHDDELGQLAHAFRLMAHEVQRREEALRQANEKLEQRVEQRTRELTEVQQRLVETARQAGRAEIATNVLHNVGNVLNSVNTSAMLVKERLNGLKLEQVGRVAGLLKEHQGDLATFLTQNERGRNVLPFLSQLGQHMREERQELLTLLDDVSRYTDHIGTIVKLQQRYARIPQVHEMVLLADLVEDALRINAEGLARHAVRVERSLAPLPPVRTDKHKVLMILVNLISNAKYALDKTTERERRLTVVLDRPADDRIRIEVRDNGVGIAPELLTRIFQYGFTTREEGHGFGLHSSALAAQEVGGSLTVHSEGPGRGATFTLELPFHPHEEPSRDTSTEAADLSTRPG
ncbi:ATP-binding protein [Archangium sp.]|uniref:ATP-binding protein n=1 Tax=Archangium sp. TaxID=1872627 RepID=UPI002D4DADC2|nr:ATP-binding protein [Archangium sp.]HYO51174.1 ATP-binding protein [Archangium sp.]